MFADGGHAQNAPKQPASRHRAIAITQDGYAVLRDDGRVVAFANKGGDTGTDPVLVGRSGKIIYSR